VLIEGLSSDARAAVSSHLAEENADNHGETGKEHGLSAAMELRVDAQ
jgi:hypothetical protein